MTSPDVQRHAIETFCASNGLSIVGFVEGIDESGSRTKSAWWPRLDQSIDRVEGGDADVIVVWKFSRTARNRLRWAIALDRIDTLGGAILSATEPIESATASGKFARGLLGEVNAYQADLIGETWKDAHARRIRAGLPANGKPRFGYQYSRETGFTPDDVTGPVLQETYRRYIAGESVYSLVAWLNAGSTRPVRGYGESGDGLWSDRTIRRVMDSGFAAGFITSKGTLHAGAHQPLITEAEWDAYLEARGRRRQYRRVERSEYLLSGMVWCHCGSKMHAGMFGHARVPKFRCKDAHEKRTHIGGYVSESVLAEAVHSWLQEREARLRAEVERGIHDRPAPITVDPRPALETRLAQIERKQDQLIEDRHDIPRASFDRLTAKYAAEHAAVTSELRTIRVRASAPVRILPALLERWDDLEVPAKREMLRAVIERVIVTPQRPVSRVEIRGRDDG